MLALQLSVCQVSVEDCGGVMVFLDSPVLLHDGRREPGWVCRDRHCNAREFVRRPLRLKK